MNGRLRNADRPALRLAAMNGHRVEEHVAGRQIHLLDVENLLGTGVFTQADVAWLAESYCHVAPPARDAQLVAAASSSCGLVATGFGWPGLRLRWQPGRDGADQCLLEILRDEHIEDRFTDVVIASGDGAFAAAARTLVAAGCRVVVVGRLGHINHLLYSAVADIRYLPIDDQPVASRAA